MALIWTLTVSTTAFEGAKEKFYGFRQTIEAYLTRMHEIMETEWWNAMNDSVKGGG